MSSTWGRWFWRVGKVALWLIVALGLFLGYASYVERQAQHQAQTFCQALVAGMDSTHLAEQAIDQGADRRQTRWFRHEQGHEQLYATFTGMSPFSRHICQIKAKEGRILSIELLYLD